MAPHYLKELIHPYVPKHQLRSSSKSYLAVVHYSLKSYGYTAFSVAVPALWNSLSNSLRDHHMTLENLKTSLRLILLG
jgi:hypothetical protein